MKTLLKIISFWIIIFCFCEILSRSFFPNFSSKSVESYENFSIINNKKNYYINYLDLKNLKIRDSKNDNILSDTGNLIYIIGDSISAGFGLSYENTYYSITEKILNSIDINSNINMNKISSNIPLII